jgi:hypothetical protein
LLREMLGAGIVLPAVVTLRSGEERGRRCEQCDGAEVTNGPINRDHESKLIPNAA